MCKRVIRRLESSHRPWLDSRPLPPTLTSSGAPTLSSHLGRRGGHTWQGGDGRRARGPRVASCLLGGPGACGAWAGTRSPRAGASAREDRSGAGVPVRKGLGGGGPGGRGTPFSARAGAAGAPPPRPPPFPPEPGSPLATGDGGRTSGYLGPGSGPRPPPVRRPRDGSRLPARLPGPAECPVPPSRGAASSSGPPTD